MCFSATASFTAGAVLSGLGVASVRSVSRPAHMPLAGIPFLFAAQQITEGVLWLSLTHPSWEPFREFTTYGFLIIAQVLWPLCLPVAFILFEPDAKRKKWMKLFLGTGVLTAVYFLYCLIVFPVDARVEHNHIYYDLDFPVQLVPVAAFLYVISTSAPPLFSSSRKIQLIGLIIASFYVLTRLYFQPNLISVWCYFGTTIALFIYMALRERIKDFSSKLSAGNDVRYPGRA